MKISPNQLALILIGVFGSIVAANIAVNWKSNEDFKTKLQNLAPSDLMTLRTRIISEENMQEEPAPEVIETD